MDVDNREGIDWEQSREEQRGKIGTTNVTTIKIHLKKEGGGRERESSM